MVKKALRKKLKLKIENLYEGNSTKAHNFRYALLTLDVVTILFLVVSTFFQDTPLINALNIVCGIYLAVDYFARIWITPNKIKFTFNILNLADFIAMISFLAPLLEGNFGFLRGLRILRLLRSYRLQDKLRQDFIYFKKHEDVILSASNLFVFIFIMTEMVFVTQVDINPEITHFLDAMYFTVATLTTTGFGDVVLLESSGHIISIIIMIFGVSLFIRLAQALFRPIKVHYTCGDCGLNLHDTDSSHCKHCGHVLKIPTEGIS